MMNNKVKNNTQKAYAIAAALRNPKLGKLQRMLAQGYVRWWLEEGYAGTLEYNRELNVVSALDVTQISDEHAVRELITVCDGYEGFIEQERACKYLNQHFAQYVFWVVEIFKNNAQHISDI